jgi:hypothetical protein
MSPLTFVMTEEQMLKVDEISVTCDQSAQFETATRMQADSDLWFKLRQTRLTASKIGSICNRTRGGNISA